MGTNARLDSLQAAFLRTKLRHLAAWTEARRSLAAGYRERLQELPIRLPAEPAEAPHTYHQFTIRAQRRDALQRHLAENGIGSRIYYPITLPMQPAFSEMGHKSGDFPISEALASEVLSLPIFPGLTGEEQDRVAGTVRDFYAELKGGGP